MSNLRTLLAAAALGSAAVLAQAAPGISVTAAQESAVHPGMTQSEVRAVLGAPERVFHFASEAGPSWTYNAPAMDDGIATFAVDFGADGRVADVQSLTSEID